MITITNEDNMKLMARYPDNYFDLAIVDPPYGILNKTKRGGDYKFNMDEYGKWDVKPDIEYFNELFRVSKHQIIWGGNYFGHLWTNSPFNKGFIIWDKNQPESLNNFSMAEMAWSSLDMPSKIFRYSVRKNRNKIHPTQKPIELYQWLLKMYAKKGYKVLDTHLGSGTIAVACYEAGISLTACEIDKSYFNKSLKKIKEHHPTIEINTDVKNTAQITPLSKNNNHTNLKGNYKNDEEQLRLFEEGKVKYRKIKPTLKAIL